MQGITDVITLNVSGTLFQSTRTTLNNSPFLAALIKAVPNNNGTDPTAIPFIDRDAKSFRHVLALLRDPAYPFPATLRHELNFHGLTLTVPHTDTVFEIEKYALFDDILHLSPENRAKAAAGPVQLVPKSGALPMCGWNLISSNQVEVSFVITPQLESNIRACGCPIGEQTKVGESSQKTPVLSKVVCDNETKMFAEVCHDKSTVIKRVTRARIEKWWDKREDSGLYLSIVPVMKSLGETTCTALLATLNRHGHKFK